MDREQFLALLARLRGEGEQLTAAEFAELAAAAVEHAEDTELAEIETGCQALGDDDGVPLDVVRAAVDLVDSVRTEASVRLTAAEEETAERDALRARLAGETDSNIEDEPGGDPAPDADPDATPEGDPEATPEGGPDPEVTPPAEPEPEPEAAQPAAEVPVAVPAAARPAPRPASTAVTRRPSGMARPAAQRAHNRIVRDGGGEFGSLAEASLEMLRRREAFLSASADGVGEMITVGSIVAEYPDDRKLDGFNAARNAETFAKIVSDLDGVNDDRLEAITAAGGFCAPVTPYYGIPRISTNDRPVRDSLIGFQATRGGITYRRPPDYTAFASASDQWTRTNDITPGADGPATKPVLVVACLDPVTDYLYAVTMRLRFGNFMAMADPETVQDATDKALDAHASLAETLLLDAMKAASTEVDGGSAFGAFRDLLFHWGVAAAGYRSRRRMRPDAVLELRAPAWVRDMIREDVARSLNAYPDQYAMADDLMNRALSVRNIRPYWYQDSPTVTGGIEDHRQVFGTQPTGALVDFPESVQWQMSPPGTFLFLENGSLNFGPVRDSTLIGTNDYEVFAEDFEGLSRIGYQSLWGNSIVCPNGASAGTSSPDLLCGSGGQYIPTGSGLGAFSAP